jgi:hypothetical protein
MWSMSLQSQIAEFSKAYVEHVNNVINGTSATIDLPPMPIGMSHLDFVPRGGSPGAKSEAGGRKKRKRAPVDPNAPKRPLTPFFLYMQNNRPKIAEDLGSEARPKNIADEGTRRWQEMDVKEKEVCQSHCNSSNDHPYHLYSRAPSDLEVDVRGELREIQD